MIGSMQSAYFDPTTGTIKVILNNSTINGYANTVDQYNPYGIMSIPLPDALVNLDRQSSAQVQSTGYKCTVKDASFTINAGEIGLYSINWYNMTANAGIYMQPRNTVNKENAVMGQSTNLVLVDMMNLLIDIINYLGTHVHTGVTTGSGDTGTPLTPPPDDSTVISDKTYISGNKNLAITGTYTPK